jgi:hypothetical protein
VARDLTDALVTLGRPREPRDETRHQAALNLARAARGHPELDGRDEAETQLNEVEALSTVLGALGYRTQEQVVQDAVRREQVNALRRRQRQAVTAEPVAVSEERLSCARRRALQPSCGDDRGSERGYRRHLSAYSTPCGACLSWRTGQLDERWRRLGVNPESEVVLPT